MQALQYETTCVVRVPFALEAVKLIVPSITDEQLEALKKELRDLSSFDASVAPVGFIWSDCMYEASQRINEKLEDIFELPKITDKDNKWLELLQSIAGNAESKSITSKQLSEFIYKHIESEYVHLSHRTQGIYTYFANTIYRLHDGDCYSGDLVPTDLSYGEVIVYYVAEIFGIEYQVNYNVFN